jgi:hypothetical protein
MAEHGRRHTITAPLRACAAARVRFAATLGVLAMLAAACVPPGTAAPDGAVTVEMDANYASGFFSLPWPNDVRRTPAGTLDLFGLPAQDSLLVAQLVQAASNELTAFGTNSAAYLRTTGTIDPSSLPTPAASTSPDSPLQLVALDGSGERVPVIARVEPADGFRPTNLISLLPYPGHALAPATRYGVIVTTGLRDADGESLAPAPLIERLDEPFRPGLARSAQHWQALRAQRDELRALLSGEGVVPADELVGFSVYQTAESTATMRAVNAAVDSFPIEVPELTPVGPCDPVTGRRHFAGRLTVPRFQAGDTTVTAAGGRIEIGADGRAVVQRVGTTGVGVNVPCGPPPERGWALQTYIDGTGAGVRAAGGFGAGARSTIIGSVAPLYSPDENGAAFNDFLFYNFLNPAAAATNPVQQAADNRVLVRMLQRLELDGALVDSPAPVTTDDDTVVLSGHSQGAQTVTLVAFQLPEVRAIVTSASTSGRYNSVSYRSDVRGIVAQLLGTPVRLDVRNPFVQVIQTLFDATEPANFPTSGHWLNFAGRDDGCLPLESSRHLAASQGLAVVDPQAPSLFGEPSLDPIVAGGPVAGNGPGGTTRVSIEAAGRHRVAFANATLAATFIDTVVAGATPVVDAGPYDGGATADGCSARFGVIGNHE